MILFLKKRDLFEEKIQTLDIASIPQFADFPGEFGADNYYDIEVEYLLDKFRAVNENPDRVIHHHVTCATDSQNVAAVFNSCKDIILRARMTETSFM